MVYRSEILEAYLNSIFIRLNLKNYFTFIHNYYRTYTNYTKIIKARVLNKFPIEAILRDNRKVILEDQIIAYYYSVFYNKFKNIKINESYLEFDYNNRNIRLFGWKFGDPASVFASSDYDFLNIKDKVVVDIGASIGDSPIYFALNGAKKVIAFEPFPKIFTLARKNLEENHLQDKIVLVNAGCGYDGKVRVRGDLQTDAGTQLIEYGIGVEIPVYSLNTITRMFDIENAVLKVDCEGCEYDLFRTATNETLAKFDRIIIEYHYGYKELVKRLKEANFKVKHSSPKRIKKGMILGYITAWRL
ncbi:FkbM family methyltransferase [Saccharolobus shibatae]|uniref:Methyltransferase FkbM domain-containing protein n=1 Tax=Saccharolobus shibatae TaxID=2286 RepID=A0A8F5C0R1_9CREN|nr:FkbM family methyltransferase [Saccharolobus shibatae]QXJ34886.1 hypothetical protein J5U22_01433 [Saccharolobus shibatae]